MTTYPSQFSSQQLLEILTQAKTATAIHSTDEMIIETANDAMIAIWGKDRTVIGKPLEDALPELKGQPFLGLLQSVLHTGKTISGSETRADLVVNGVLQPFYFDFEYKAITNAAGAVICVLNTAINVTDRYLSSQREMQLEVDLQAANEELASTNEELAASNEELGASNEELASTIEELTVTNEELAESQEILQTMNYTLAESESRFRSMMKQAPVGICIIRAGDLMIQEVNDAYLELVGRHRSAMENRTIWEAVPESASTYAPIMNEVISTNIAFHASEHEFTFNRNGITEQVFVNFVYEPFTYAEGFMKAIMVIAFEVTDQVLARQKIEQSQNRLNSMVMTVPIGMTVLRGRDLVIEVANDPMYEIWSRTPHQTIGKKLMDVFPELIDQPFPQLLQNVFNTGERLAIPEIDVRIATPMGEVNYIIDFAYDPLFDLEGNVEAVLTTVSNITEQVKAREELQKARDTLKQAIESAEMGTWSVMLSTDALTVSEQGKKMHGLADNAKLTLKDTLKLIAPAYVDKVKNAIQQSMETNQSFDVEYIINPADGSKPRWLKSTGKAYYDDDNKPKSVAGIMIDITESKAYDQQKDDFISIASHELKTPVTSLKAALQLMDRMKEKDSLSPQMMAKLIEQSNRSMDKISTLIEDLLNLSRMNEGQLRLEKSTFTIADLLNQCCNHVRVAGKHELITRGDEKLKVNADEHRIDQVIVNMVNNAVKYAPNSKLIILSIEKQGKMAKISVKDTGPGIAPEKLSRLFERYYRTDASGYQNSGLGLGLYISAEIVRKHGGEIGVDSELGKGSTFWFTLPLK
ncbi:MULTISPECIES: PAS domain-containing protein [unclassified Mucilaginibacter]|uniref:PAS domain-containing protein n=2 Tax=Pseudomonadati TaxID=3379134 RepID=UPI002AC9E5AC|nr:MULTISPECIES: PAS domain-containing protein [unclassified Mucilaginibacter]MEB0260255.1 PAS domain-containing protein [Mucilaginibacter sp. 10I4]MEB0277334.1 PAS domain-containing protein [Mucilaginibacter sp. 10B2]MEB0300184.1 PAS domain-containing protein [Mucilaginibacter sp. 5C4]WPX25459.1 PAS domain-containing protein [Mucilaginibacter sp. 5C4]